MYKIAICEDNALFAEHLSKEISDYFSNMDISVQPAIFLSATDMLTNNTKFHLYFLDILLPDGNGLDIAKELQARNKQAVIIFVSNNESAVFDAIHYSPLRFIRKNRLAEELPEACKAYLDNQSANISPNCDTILVYQNSSKVIISIDSIQYMETKGHYVDFFCGENTYHIRGRLNDYANLCSNIEFGRSAQSFLVHFSYIASFSSTEITLKSGQRIPLSRSRKQEFKDKFMRYQRIKQYGNTI